MLIRLLPAVSTEDVGLEVVANSEMGVVTFSCWAVVAILFAIILFDKSSLAASETQSVLVT